MKRVLIIPANNEEESIVKVLGDIPKNFIEQIIVVNNASTDKTKELALENGAIVVDENRKGYGYACLAGLAYVKENLEPDLIYFMDADYSDYPEDMLLLDAKFAEGYDFVLGSRTLGKQGSKGLSSTNKLGNKLAGFFLKLLFRKTFTDLGPFRAIKAEKLFALNMQDTNYGWTIEMQIKAIRNNLKICEVPVNYRFRYAGESKVTGTLKGSILAFSKITYMFAIYFFRLK